MNNKLHSLLIAAFGVFSICNLEGANDAYNKQLAMQFVKLVQKRYYFIHRLEKPIKVLFSLFEKNQPPSGRNFASINA